MCGIAGIYVKNPGIVDSENDRVQFDRFFDELLLGIEERGTDATGFITTSGTKVQIDKKPIPASSFIKTRKRAWLEEGTRIVLGHTRLATQGHQSQFANNHPVMYGTTFVTHNGHIHNDDVVYEDLELERHAEVDSSAIAAALHYHGFNADDAKTALEMLGGGFAIAAINPVDATDTLLLAKGGGMYPLAYYETKHVFVWASTSHALLDAWKAVLGTPPIGVNVKYLDNGDMLWIKDGEVELAKSAFTPKPKYKYQTSSRSTGYSWNDWRDDNEGSSCSTPIRPSRAMVTVLDNKDYMKALRNSGGGRAVTWDRKNDMSDDHLRMYDGKWSQCYHCEEMVARFCLINHITWGEICWDCLAYGNSQLEAEKKKGPDWAGMAQDDLEQLEEYAILELDFTDTIVEKMAEETGLNDRLIWWLLFCSNLVNLGLETDELKQKLQYLYEDKEAEFFDKQEDDAGSFLPDDAEIPIPPARQIEQTTTIEMGKCDHCKKKTTFMTYKNGRHYRWCDRHIIKCFKRGCKSSPVAWGSDGRRWCHPHARHVKGLTYVEKVELTTT